MGAEDPPTVFRPDLLAHLPPRGDQLRALVHVFAVVLAQPTQDVVGAGLVRVLPLAVHNWRLSRPVRFGNSRRGLPHRPVQPGHLFESGLALGSAEARFRPLVYIGGLSWRIQRLQLVIRVCFDAVEHATVMDEDPVDMDLKTTERVIIARLEVRESGIWHLREDRLPLCASGVEVGQRSVSVHGG